MGARLWVGPGPVRTRPRSTRTFSYPATVQGEGAPVERKPLKSEMLKSVGYDPATHEMEVEFADGSVHVYSRVPPKVHKDLMKAKKVAYYFGKKVRTHYSSREVE